MHTKATTSTILPRPGPFEYEKLLPLLPAITGSQREDLAASRSFLEQIHRQGASGETIVRLQSTAMDRVVLALWDRALGEARAVLPESPTAVVALGGYGRSDLAPYSDIDLLLLHEPGEPNPFVKLISERFLYALWDLKLEVGYGVRDVPGCQSLAEQDHTARTALLDLRYLAGDRELYRQLERGQLHELSQAKSDSFIADKIAEVLARREKYGDSIYLLEPNVKQSEGGMRDLQSALWIARARWKVKGTTEILSRAILPELEVAELRSARDFLWRVRNELHYLARRKSDQLTFDAQPLVARFLGYCDDPEGSAVEQFMRHYYLAAKVVLTACDAIVDRALEQQGAIGWRQSQAPASLSGAESPKGPARSEWPLPGGEFKVFRGRLTVVDKEVLRRSPAAIVRLFAVADREGLDLYPYARDQVGEAAAELPPEAASNPEVNQELLACLMRPGTRGRFLSRMHQLGVLPRILPEFAHVTARRQIDVYHVYTVDVHSLFAVRRLLALRSGDVEEPLIGPLMRELKRPLGLYLGTLFHDIGKGLGGEHEVRGAEIAARACVRLGIDPADAADVEWLVLKHLRMSTIAQRRDLSDPDLIHSFAEECGTIDRLDKLYLLTYGDISTVGPQAWNDWKARLLRELYEKTREVMEQGVERRPEPGTAEAVAREAIAAAIRDRAPEAVRARFLAAMPARYFLTTDPREAPRHLRLLEFGQRRVFAAVTRHRRELGHSDLVITAPDRPGLLALFAGVLAANRVNIQHAKVFSTPADEQAFGWLAGRALDVFEVRGPEGGALDPARWRATRRDLSDVLSGKVRVEDLLARRLRASSLPSKPLPGVATKVHIDNDSSRHHSVIDVFTADRVGLLYTLSQTAFELGLSVDLARITTEGHRAADAFYVRTAGGERLEGAAPVSRVVESISAALERPPFDALRR